MLLREGRGEKIREGRRGKGHTFTRFVDCVIFASADLAPVFAVFLLVQFFFYIFALYLPNIRHLLLSTSFLGYGVKYLQCHLSAEIGEINSRALFNLFWPSCRTDSDTKF